MSLNALTGRLAPLAIVLLLGGAVAGCSTTGGFITTHTTGYEISDDALAQIRVGQSRELVNVVLGSPQTTSTFGNESAYYYVETKVADTAFGVSTIKDRRVLAIYFDQKGKVKDTALYGVKDGRTIAIDSRRTPSFGQDKTFIDSIMSSVTSSSGG
ncbi:MAG TPA: outer membrane protein assembly factor BamE [Devosiaceae bacterium]|jgi:outer membrane protein assembly factor BamE (lipoprotein component of BamABCDE complex)